MATPKKAAAPKEKPKKAATHPPFKKMVTEAIAALKDFCRKFFFCSVFDPAPILVQRR